MDIWGHPEDFDITMHGVALLIVVLIMVSKLIILTTWVVPGFTCVCNECASDYKASSRWGSRQEPTKLEYGDEIECQLTVHKLDYPKEVRTM